MANNTVCFNDILGQSLSGRTVGGIIASIAGGILAGAGVLSGNLPLALAGVGLMTLGGEELPFMIHPNMIRALLLKNYMMKCLHLKNMTEKTLLMTLQLMKLINYTHQMDLLLVQQEEEGGLA